ncbi:hypothetical protein GE09DRAFT_1056034 [Coniochaeta sp. 2T2.1]|nr:hypothetical protein GE09DRAFT_1056034 [Coniochaeta sp. 2T2.1]
MNVMRKFRDWEDACMALRDQEGYRGDGDHERRAREVCRGVKDGMPGAPKTGYITVLGYWTLDVGNEWAGNCNRSFSLVRVTSKSEHDRNRSVFQNIPGLFLRPCPRSNGVVTQEYLVHGDLDPIRAYTALGLSLIMCLRPLVITTVTVDSEMPSSTAIVSTSYNTSTQTKDSNSLSGSEHGNLDLLFHPRPDSEVSSQTSIASHVHSHDYAEQPSSNSQPEDHAEDNLSNLSIHDIEVRIAYLRYEMTAHARTTIASNYELWLARCQWQSKLDKLWEEFCGDLYDQRVRSWDDAIALLVPPERWRERHLRGRQMFDRWRQLYRDTIGLAKHRFYQAQEAEREVWMELGVLLRARRLVLESDMGDRIR